MKHGIQHRHFGRRTEHRMSMLINLAKSIFLHGRIRTTVEKAKDARVIIEKLITRGRNGVNDLHKWRMLFNTLRDETIVKNIIEHIGPFYKSRPGGYTRIMRDGFRNGDQASVAIFELVDYAQITALYTPKYGVNKN